MERHEAGTAWAPGRRVLTAGLVLVVTGIGFEGLAVPTILPATLRELPGLTLYGWAFSAFWLANLVGIAVAGSQADRRGPLMPFLAGMLAFAAGLAVAGVAPSMAWVVVGRAVQGLGAGALSSITYVAIARGYDTAAQPRMIAVISSAWVLPGLLGPLVAGWVSETWSWRWVFLGLAPLVPLAAMVMARGVADLGRPAAPAGLAGAHGTMLDAFRLAAGGALLLASLSIGNAPAAGLAAVAGVVLGLRPLRRLLLGGAPAGGAAVVTLALLSVAFFGVEAFIPLSIASIRNAGTVAGGLALTAAALTWASGSWWHARVAGTRSRRSVTIAGLLLVALGIVGVSTVPVTALPAVAVAAAAWAVAGLGMGLAYSAATVAAIESAPAGAEGAASAAIQLASTIGVGFGTGMAGALIAFSARGGLGVAPGIVLGNLAMLVALGAAVLAARRMRGGMPAGGIPSPAAGAAARGPSLSP